MMHVETHSCTRCSDQPTVKSPPLKRTFILSPRWLGEHPRTRDKKKVLELEDREKGCKILSFEYRTVTAITNLQQLELPALGLSTVSHRWERCLAPPWWTLGYGKMLEKRESLSLVEYPLVSLQPPLDSSTLRITWASLLKLSGS